MYYLRSLLLILAAALLLLSCESKNSFRSEAGVKKDLQGIWQWVPVYKTDLQETWQFDNGNLTVTEYNRTTGGTRVSAGTYTVQTTVTTPYIFIEGMQAYSGKWIVINLNKTIFTMVITTQGTNALVQKEFIKL